MRAVIVAAAVAFLVSLFGTPLAIRVFTRLKAGQPIRADGPQTHLGKKGTPDDGRRRLHRGHGHRVRRRSPRPDHPAGRSSSPRSGRPSPRWCCSGLFVFCGAVGFIDDFLKVRKRNSAGLSKRGKLLGQTLVGAVFGIVALYVPERRPRAARPWPASTISFVRDIELARHQQGRRGGRSSSSWSWRCPTP